MAQGLAEKQASENRLQVTLTSNLPYILAKIPTLGIPRSPMELALLAMMFP